MPRGMVLEGAEYGPIEAVPVKPSSKGDIIHKVLLLKDGESFAVRGLPWKNLYDRLTWVRVKYNVLTRIEKTGEERVFRVCLKRTRAYP